MSKRHVTLLTVIGLVMLVAGSLIAPSCGGSSSSKDEKTFRYVSSSMKPTLKPGQRIRVKLGARCCQRGDIVLFRTPGEPASANPNVKRVIGLPGETVTLPGDGRVYINGRPFEGALPRRSNQDHARGRVAARLFVSRVREAGVCGTTVGVLPVGRQPPGIQRLPGLRPTRRHANWGRASRRMTRRALAVRTPGRTGRRTERRLSPDLATLNGTYAPV